MKCSCSPHCISRGISLSRRISVRFPVVAIIALVCLPVPAFGICSVTPRVCTEFFRSNAVFTGKVISERDWWPGEKDLDPRTYYTLQVEEVFRGPQRQMEVYTERNSGGMGLGMGHEYLLFAHYGAGGLQIGCGGNSAELKDAARTIEELKRLQHKIKTAHGGDIYGWARDSDSDSVGGVPNLQITISGSRRTYTVLTDRKGRFQVHVPAGRYVAKIRSPGWKSDEDAYTYDIPQGFEVANGGCADVTFLAERIESSSSDR